METPKVIIIGGGFGGLAAAKALSGGDLAVTLIDRTNHHLFQPLLYQVATAGLSPANIAQPLRYLLRDAENIEVIWSEVSGIDTSTRSVTTTDGVFPYGYLIVAAGARHAYFGKPEWEQFAPGLKTLEDAVELRRRILTAFEMAEKATTPEERQAALTFVVIGGGPTGVEMAGSMAELARQVLVRDFRHINPTEARVIMIDAAPKVLPSFAPELSDAAYDSLSKLGVDVRTNMRVEEMNAEGMTAGGVHIPARTIVWAAGNQASSLGKMLGVETDRAGRVMVGEDLSIAGHPEVFVIGDMACFTHQDGKPLPGVSPVAIQMGAHAVSQIRRSVCGKARKKFHYHDRGSMATIGRNYAVADLHFIKLTGIMAWMSWLFIHLIFIIGLRNQVLILLQWMYAYFTYARSARLITGNFQAGRKP